MQLQTLIFVKSSEKPNISDVAKISVKTGMGGRYGNKGAILARFVIDDSSICFLNCHLAVRRVPADYGKMQLTNHYFSGWTKGNKAKKQRPCQHS